MNFQQSSKGLRRIVLSVFVSLFILSLFLNFLFFRKDGSLENKEFERLQKTYPLLSKRILQDHTGDILLNFLDLRRELKGATEDYGDQFSFYFEYLPTGTSIGINEKSEFSAASLIKIPIIMAYRHEQERLGVKVEKDLVIEEEDLEMNFGELWKKGSGTLITDEEAIKLAITESDNTAANLLFKEVNEEDFDKVYESLDIDLRITDQTPIITTKHFSSVLKALFFSSVLSKDNSNQILDLMTQTKFNDGLVAGVPKSVKVAHKIGIFKLDSEENGYMDCGIVYIPNRPYLLCMLFVGEESEVKEKMADISSRIYKYVSKKAH